LRQAIWVFGFLTSVLCIGRYCTFLESAGNLYLPGSKPVPPRYGGLHQRRFVRCSWTLRIRTIDFQDTIVTGRVLKAPSLFDSALLPSLRSGWTRKVSLQNGSSASRNMSSPQAFRHFFRRALSDSGKYLGSLFAGLRVNTYSAVCTPAATLLERSPSANRNELLAAYSINLECVERL
jgi:hypothetical protein